LADTLITDPSKIVYLIIPHGIDMLPLFREAIALLPINQRWQATFSTYYATDLASDVRCAWRCVISGTTMASKITSVRSALVIDLTQPRSLNQSGGMIDAARTGILNDQKPPQEKTITPMPTRMGYSEIKPVFTRDPAETYEILHPEGYPKSITKPPKTRQYEKISTSSSRPAPVFWILAALWPIVVAGGVLVWIQAFRTGEKTAQITQPTSIPTSGPAESEDYKQKYQEEIEKHDATRNELKTVKDDLEKLNKELSKNKALLEKAISIQDEKPANEPEPINRANPVPDSLSTQTSKIDPAGPETSSINEAGISGKSEKNISIDSLGILIVPIPDSLETIHPDDPITIHTEFDLSKLSDYEKLEPKFLNNLQEISTPDRTHRLKIIWQESSLSVTHSSASAFETSSDKEIFRLTYEGGKKWSCTFTDYFVKLREKDIQIWAYQAIKTAAISVEKDQVIQFCRPKRQKWQLDKQDKVTLELPLGIKPTSDELSPLQLSQISASKWSVHSSKNQLLFKRCPTTKKTSPEEHSEEFHVEIGADDQKSYQLQSNWKHKIQTLETQEEIIKKIDELAKQLQRLITEITNNKQNSPSQDTKSSLQEPIKQLNQNLEKLIQGNHLDAFRDIGIVWVPVRFPNGAIYQIFELITGK
jgi:hypothetical protein